MGTVRGWIARLNLRIEDAALLAGMQAEQLERMLSVPELAPPTLKDVLQVLDGLGLGIAGVEPLTTTMVVRRLDQCREAKKVSKVDLATRSGCNRQHMTYMFQQPDPDPKLETVLKLAAALDYDLKLVQRRATMRPIVDPRSTAPRAAEVASPTPAPQSSEHDLPTSTPPSPGPSTAQAAPAPATPSRISGQETRPSSMSAGPPSSLLAASAPSSPPASTSPSTSPGAAQATAAANAASAR